MITKVELRQKQKQTREQINIKVISEQIIKKLLSLNEFISAKKIFTYISTEREVDTTQILELKNKEIFVPKILDKSMIMTKYTPNNLIKNKFGIYEPQIYTSVKPNESDVIIVPALSVDREFNRLGYGGGYYDRFFMKNNQGIKIAIIPEKLFTEKIKTDIYDIKMNILVTENNIYRNYNH